MRACAVRASDVGSACKRRRENSEGQRICLFFCQRKANILAQTAPSVGNTITSHANETSSANGCVRVCVADAWSEIGACRGGNSRWEFEERGFLEFFPEGARTGLP